MRSDYGVQWVGEADAVRAVVSIVAIDFADQLTDEVEDVAGDPQRLADDPDLFDGRPVAYAFEWYAYVVTVIVRLSNRLRLMYVDRVTIEAGVGGINPFE